jgi:epoxide hydrolase-like predicted phosphatase
MAIKAVIWDLGGVLLRTEDFSSRLALADRIGKSRAELEDLVFDGDSGDRAQLGEISADEHWENIRRMLGLDEAGISEFRRQFWEGDQLDHALVDTIRSLRGRYKTGLLSNAFSDLRQWVSSLPNFTDAFDEMIISAEMHLVKPDPRIYQAALQRLGAAANEAVFIDDLLENVAGARRQGLHGIHFRQRSQALAELGRMLEGGVAWMKQS